MPHIAPGCAVRFDERLGTRIEITVPGRSAEEVVARLKPKRSLVDTPLLPREVSAQLFWNQSKALDAGQALVAAVLGLDECLAPETPVQLLAALPTHQSSPCFSSKTRQVRACQSQ
jgi:hypothetical protein